MPWRQDGQAVLERTTAPRTNDMNEFNGTEQQGHTDMTGKPDTRGGAARFHGYPVQKPLRGVGRLGLGAAVAGRGQEEASHACPLSECQSQGHAHFVKLHWAVLLWTESGPPRFTGRRAHPQGDCVWR